VNEQGVSNDNGKFVQSFRWAYFKRYGETPNLLLLITKAGDTMFMPKRALDESAMDELKMLICEHIAEGSFDKGTAAFPVLMPPY
jgi:hypothetical protein